MNELFILPTDLEPAERVVAAPAPGEKIGFHHPYCFGCGTENEWGLRLTAVAGEGMSATSTVFVDKRLEGGPGVIHGGLLSTAFDEAMGKNHALIGCFAVTVHLQIDFAKPIPLGTTLRIETRIDGRLRRKLYMSAEAYFEHEGPEAKPVAASRGLFVIVDPQAHYQTTKMNSQGF